MFIFYKITHLLLFACFITVKIVRSVEWSKDSKLSDIEDDDSISQTDCSDHNEIQGICNNKEYNGLDNLYNIFFNNKYNPSNSKNKRTSISSHDTRIPCQCEMTYKLVDLGSSIYPRRIHTGVCKKTPCGLFHRCQPKRYKIRLLKKRDSDVEMSGDIHPELPESLAEEWIFDYVNIVIACECIPIKI